MTFLVIAILLCAIIVDLFMSFSVGNIKVINALLVDGGKIKKIFWTTYIRLFAAYNVFLAFNWALYFLNIMHY